jgi:hypothetical protein
VLQSASWQSIRIWEHEDPVKAAGRLAALITVRSRLAHGRPA